MKKSVIVIALSLFAITSVSVPAEAQWYKIGKKSESDSYQDILKSNNESDMKEFISKFPESDNLTEVQALLFKKETIGRRVRAYRNVSFVVDSVNLFMGFGVERKAEYVVAIEGKVTDVTDSKKLKYTVDKAYVTNSSKNSYRKGEVGDLRYRPTAQKKANEYLNSSQTVSSSTAKYVD